MTRDVVHRTRRGRPAPGDESGRRATAGWRIGIAETAGATLAARSLDSPRPPGPMAPLLTIIIPTQMSIRGWVGSRFQNKSLIPLVGLEKGVRRHTRTGCLNPTP